MGELLDPLIDENERYGALSDRWALWFILKGCLGTGILSMPFYYKQLGYVNAAFWTLLLGTLFVASTYNLLVNFKLLRTRYRVKFLQYGDAMKLATENGPILIHPFANCFRIFTNATLFFMYFGACCSYVAFVADNLKMIVATVSVWNIDSCVLAFTLLPFLLVTFLGTGLRSLGKFIIIANVGITIGFLVLSLYLAIDLPPLSERKYFNDFSTLPQFYGTLLFSLNPVGLFLGIERHMLYRKHFHGLLIRVMAFVIPLNIAMGFFGYWQFGDNVQSTITLALSKTHIESLFIRVAFAVAIFFSYSNQGFYCIEIIYHDFLFDKPNNSLEIMLRVLFVLLTIFVNMLREQLQSMMAFVGVTSVSILGIIFPAILDYCLRHPYDYGRITKWLFIDGAIILAGAAMSFYGLFRCLVDVINQLDAPKLHTTYEIFNFTSIIGYFR